MAAKSWNPFSCCVGGARVADDGDDCKRRIRRSAKGCPRSSSRMSFKSLSSSGTLSPEDLSITLSGSNLHAFTYAELRAATGSFSRANYLGCGGFGPVYKGAVDDKLRPGLAAQAVAVKYLDLDCGTQGHKEWLAEVFFLGQLRHKNLVKLIGYCYEDKHRMLVYEFMSGESLEKHLFKSINGSLPWMTRMKIAVGAAKGLAFLHDADPPVIYRDFKASNILLDSDYNTKLSDFGLAKDGPQGDATHPTSRYSNAGAGAGDAATPPPRASNPAPTTTTPTSDPTPTTATTTGTRGASRGVAGRAGARRGVGRGAAAAQYGTGVAWRGASIGAGRGAGRGSRASYAPRQSDASTYAATQPSNGRHSGWRSYFYASGNY
ncbi:hypothetical protein ZWY2020_038917 [Hordeum vulgare]|nr:hypothetical protein ZWY2020_038917 [Hordeum vulgare]